MSAYTNLEDSQVMDLARGLEARPACVEFHDYIDRVRELVDGKDALNIPESHRGLKVGENHEGSNRLNSRIKQGASWLGAADIRFNVGFGSPDQRDAAARMWRFARYGEQLLGRGTQIHKWKQETYRDFMECGVSIIQQNARAEYYVAAMKEPNRLVQGAKLNEIIWRRRVDPLSFFWDEGEDGEMPSVMIKGNRELTEVAKIAKPDGRATLRRLGLEFSESLPGLTTSTAAGKSVDIREVWVGDFGYLIAMNEKRGSGLKPDDPARIVARWENKHDHPPFYITAGTWPWHSPLDEMIQLTNERNYWATMLDLQAAGAIFRHWQLVDEGSGDPVARSIWQNNVPENILLDLTQPPPNMGPGTKWEIAPFEFHDVLPRYQQIVASHEAAGQAVAQLMGQQTNGYTAVGTVDMMEEFARREFSDPIDGFGDTYSRIWADTFKYIRVHHKDKVVVSGRKRNMAKKDDGSFEGDLSFFNTTVEVTGADIVSEDIEATLDTRSRIAKIADYQLGREMQNNGDIGFDRRVEQGLVPWVDDADEEKAAIFIDTVENMQLEVQANAAAQQTAQNVSGAVPMQPPAPANITRGARTDPRGTGTGAGANNMANTALGPTSPDVVQRAS